jgi:predicted DNA-binding transcriptional regulator AlpA
MSAPARQVFDAMEGRAVAESGVTTAQAGRFQFRGRMVVTARMQGGSTAGRHMENIVVLRVLREPDAMLKMGIRSKQHFRQLIAAGMMPRPIKLGVSAVGWLEHELDALIAKRIVERDAADPAVRAEESATTEAAG